MLRCFLLLVVTFLFPLAGISRAVTILEGPTVKQVDDGLLVYWKTDAPAGGKVRYGLIEDKLDQSIEDGIAAEHRVHLPSLQPGAHYFFSVGTARKVLQKGTFDTSGSATRIFIHTSPASKPATAESSPARTVPPLQKTAPPTRAIWGNLPSLQDHFERHGGDFRATSPDDYAAQAWRFRERATTLGLPMKQDTDGTVRVFDPKSSAFAAYNRDGTVKTYFRPNNPSYWQRQPGRPITTAPWISK